MTDTTAEFTFKSISSPFTQDGNTVKINNIAIMRHIGNVTMINTTARQNLSVDSNETFDFMMLELLQSGRTVKRLENFAEFFDGDLQFKTMLKSNAEDNANLAKSIGLDLTDQDLKVISSYHALRSKVVDFFKSIYPKPAYNFSERNGENKLSVHKESKTEAVQSPGGYWITRKQAENIWRRASKVWSGEGSDDGKGRIRKDWRDRCIKINDTGVTIGCQRMTRWQVEDAALRLGFIEAL